MPVPVVTCGSDHVLSFLIRTNGLTNSYNRLQVAYTGNGVSHMHRGFVECDSSGLVEYLISSNAGTQNLNIFGWKVDV